MSGPGVRRAWLDACPGERRGVVTLDGRPEHLLIERTGEPPFPRLGEHRRVRLGQRPGGGREAFVDLGPLGSGVIRLPSDTRLTEGALIDAEVVTEPQNGKTARLALIAPAPPGSAPGLLRPGPDLEARLARLAPEAAITIEDDAREIADLAVEAALATLHTLEGGVTLSLETTRAMTVADVDYPGLGERGRRAERANLAAVEAFARLLRLKSLGGLAAIDLLGDGDRRSDALLATARRVFGNEDGASVLPPNRFGVLMVTRPRRRRPVHEILLGDGGRPTPRTLAQRLVRALEREGRADPGALLEVACLPAVAAELRPLAAELGPRFSVREAAGLGPEEAHIRPRP